MHWVNSARLHPEEPQSGPRLVVPGSVDRVGSPASIHGVRGCPCPTDGVRRERQGRPTVMGPDGLMDDRNGSGHIRHLLPNTAFRLTANSKSALKAQEEVVFSQVSLLLHRSVASL